MFRLQTFHRYYRKEKKKKDGVRKKHAYIKKKRIPPNPQPTSNYISLAITRSRDQLAAKKQKSTSVATDRPARGADVPNGLQRQLGVTSKGTDISADLRPAWSMVSNSPLGLLYLTGFHTCPERSTD